MGLIRAVVSRIRGIFRREQVEREMDEELRGFLDASAEDKMQRGMSDADATRTARIEMGSTNSVKHRIHSAGWESSPDNFLRDLRYALRALLRSPGFTLVALITLALGIGANTAIFSIVENVVLAPLPYPGSDRLVMVWQSRPGVPKIGVSYSDFQDIERASLPFSGVAAFVGHSWDLTGLGSAEHLDGVRLTSGFLRMLGTKPMLGRDFEPSDDLETAAPVVIISSHLWRERFGASPAAIGRSITLDGISFTVVGILDSSVPFMPGSNVFTPLGRTAPRISRERSVHGVYCIARLKPGVGMGEAQSEMNALQQSLDRMYPADDRDIGVGVAPLTQEMVGDVDGTLKLLLGAVGLVLLIACANIANLLLARSAARTREFAVRSALGASRGRIVCQLLIESVILSLVGGALGVLLAKAVLRVVLSNMADAIPRSDEIALNLPVLLFTLAVATGLGILFGLGPALKAARTDVQSGLREGARGATGARSRVQSYLVIGQMAMTLVLLAGAGLLFRTIQRLWQVDPGFEPRHAISFRVGLSPALAQSAPATRVALAQLLERIRRIPGVEAADLTNVVPLDGGDNTGPFWLGTKEPESQQDAPHALYFWTGPDYIETMKIPLLQGRFFSANDNVQSEKVVAIDSVLARNYFPGQNPIGQSLTVAHWGTARVIGVVGHVRHWGLDASGPAVPAQIYIPLYQLPDAMVTDFFRSSLRIVVRTPLNEASILPALKAAVYSSASDQPVFDVKTIEETVDASMSPQRLPMLLLGAFAVLALVLAAVGIYGVISYSVAQRRQEIGVRMALGAGRSQILRMVVVQGLRMAAVGLCIGTVAAAILTRLLTGFSHLLFGVKAYDPLTFAAVFAALALVAVLACVIPARRAANLDPIEALRCE